MRYLVVVLALLLAFDTNAAAAPPIPKDEVISIDMKNADVSNIYQMLSNVAGRQFVLDPCVVGRRITLTLKNSPISLVLDALALQLHLTYDDQGTAVNVRCTTDDDAQQKQSDMARVTVSLKDVELPVMLDAIAKGSHLDGVDYKATTKPKVALTVQNVRIGTVLSALSDEAGLRVWISKNRLVVSDAR